MRSPAAGHRTTVDEAAATQITGSPSTGYWVGLTVSVLLASLSMVQIRSKLFDGFPTGDWAEHGYTWHFIPPFLIVLGVWYVAALVWSRRRGFPARVGLAALGSAASPMLGLVIAWDWYALTGTQFHAAGGCHTPVLCHDALPHAIAVWAGPWIAWGAFRIWKMWRRP
jgi:hypothetical protein